MKRIVTVALLAAFAGLLLAAARRRRRRRRGADGAGVARPSPSVRAAPATAPPRADLPAGQWEPDVYPRYNPGPNAVRDCTATYVQEYRPSGTVITPRMNCYWRPG